MTLRARPIGRAALRGRIKFARLLELPERDLAMKVGEIERAPLFRRLVDAGVLSLAPYPAARFAARRFAGYELRGSSSSSTEALQGDGEAVGLISRIGRDRFEECFLRDAPLSDAERAGRCGIGEDQVRMLRGLVDRLYIQAEFSSAPEAAAPKEVFSSVAGVVVEEGRPALAFFHREIWRGRYRVDDALRKSLLAGLVPAEARRTEALLRDLELLDRRKSTLYRVLEILLETQREYLVSGAPEKRRPFTQRALAMRVGVCPSVINRLVSNKAIELPWGLETPLRTLLPSRKTILRDRLFALSTARPQLKDEGLGAEVERLYGACLSRQSISRYRRELGISSWWRRRHEVAPLAEAGSRS